MSKLVVWEQAEGPGQVTEVRTLFDPGTDCGYDDSIFEYANEKSNLVHTGVLLMTVASRKTGCGYPSAIYSPRLSAASVSRWSSSSERGP